MRPSCRPATQELFDREAISRAAAPSNARRLDPTGSIPFGVGNVFAADIAIHQPRGRCGRPAAEIRRTIAAIDPAVPISDVTVLGVSLDAQFAAVRAARTMLVTFGALALGLSMIGLYAALAFAVGERTRAIALRLAPPALASVASSFVAAWRLCLWASPPASPPASSQVRSSRTCFTA